MTAPATCLAMRDAAARWRGSPAPRGTMPRTRLASWSSLSRKRCAAHGAEVRGAGHAIPIYRPAEYDRRRLAADRHRDREGDSLPRYAPVGHLHGAHFSRHRTLERRPGLCRRHARAILALRRGHRQVPRSGDTRHVACVLPIPTATSRAATPPVTRCRRNDLVADAIDEHHSHVGAVAQNVTLRDHEIRDLSSLDTAELRSDAGDLGGADGHRLKGDVARQPSGDRLANVAKEFVRPESA